MAAIFLTDDDLRPVMTYADAIELVEAGLQALAKGEASNRPRQRIRAGNSGLNVLISGYPAAKYFGYKAYSTGRGSPGMLNTLYSAEDGRLVGVLQSNWL